MSDRNKNKKNSLSEFLRYKRGEMTGEERNSFEREIQKDPFTEEASEGFELLSTEEIVYDFKKLQKRIDSKSAVKKGFIFYRIAASVAVLTIISTVFILIERDRPEKKLAEAENKALTIEIIKEEPVTLPLASNISNEVSSNIADSKKAELLPGITAAKVLTEAAVSENKGISRIKRKDSIQITKTSRPEVYLAEEKHAAPAAIGKTRSSDLSRVEGKVIASDDNMPVAGANINIKGTTTGVITDASGNFSISLQDSEKKILVASYIGMESKEFEAKTDSLINVNLNPLKSDLSDVFAVGYGMKRVEDLPAGYVAPQPLNGKPAFDKYIEENINRPDTMTSGQRVVVVLSFRVKTDGKIDSIKVERSPGKSFSDEAVRVFKSGPQWKPAEKNGIAVEDEVRLSIVFN